MHVDVFWLKIYKYVVSRLGSLTQLATDIVLVEDDTLAALNQDFGELFGVGPGGVQILVSVLSRLYEGLDRIRRAGLVMNQASRRTQYLLEGASASLLECLTYFRVTCDRSLWDPKGGFRELGQILSKYDAQLPVFLSYLYLSRINHSRTRN
jgi:hypothetical protein